MRRLLFVAGAALSVAAFADTPPPRQFAVSSRVGQAYNYAFNFKMGLLDGTGDVSMSALMKEKLLKTNGSVHQWSMAFEVKKIDDSGLLKGMADMLQVIDRQTMQRNATPLNETISLFANGKQVPNSGGFDLIYPGKAISVGEMWRNSVDVRGTPATMTFRFEGYGKYAGKSAARFTGTFEPNGLVTTLEPYSYYVDMADGKLLHSRGAARITKNNRQIDVRFEVIRR